MHLLRLREKLPNAFYYDFSNTSGAGFIYSLIRKAQEDSSRKGKELTLLLDEVDKIKPCSELFMLLNLLEGNEIHKDLSDVVLVGHSYGGMVITGVAARESQRLAQLVYLDAYLPFEGENEIALWPPDQKEKYRNDIAAGIKSRPPIPPSMLGITDPKMSEWVQERSTPHPYSTYQDPHPPPPLATASSSDNPQIYSTIPRTYIHCTLGPFSSWMEPFAVRARKLKWNVHTMAAAMMS